MINYKFVTHEELLERITKERKNLLDLRTDLEHYGFVDESRWRMFYNMTEELVNTYLDVKKDKR